MKKKTKKILTGVLGAAAVVAAIPAITMAVVACGNTNSNAPKTVTIQQALDDFVDNSSSLDGNQTILPSQINGGWLASSSQSSDQITNLWNSLNFRPMLFTSQYDYYFNVINHSNQDGTLTFQVSLFAHGGNNSSGTTASHVTSHPITVSGFLTTETYAGILKNYTFTPTTGGGWTMGVSPGATAQSLGQTMIVPTEIAVANGQVVAPGANGAFPSGTTWESVTAISGGAPANSGNGKSGKSSANIMLGIRAVVMSRQVLRIEDGSGFINVNVVKINHNLPPVGGEGQSGGTSQANNGMETSSEIPQAILTGFPLTTTYLVSDDNVSGIYAMTNCVGTLGNVITGAQPPAGTINKFGLSGPKIQTQTVFYRYVQPAVKNPTAGSTVNLNNGSIVIYGGIPAALSTGYYVTLPTRFINPQWIKNPQVAIPTTSGGALGEGARLTAGSPAADAPTSLWIAPPLHDQAVWYASMQDLYNINFPTQYRFSSWGTPKQPLVIQNAPNPLPPTGRAANTENQTGKFNPVSYWSDSNGSWTYNYAVQWGNKQPDPYYYNPEHQGAEFFGKNAVIYTTGGGTWQYCAEAYYSFGYVNTNTDWGYDSNGQMFLTNTNLNIAQGLFASNNGENFLAALGGGSSIGTSGSVNGRTVGMPIPWEFLALPDSYSALSATAISDAVAIWPNIMLYGEANLAAETSQLQSIYIPSTYNNGLSTLLNTTTGVGNVMSGGLIVADTNSSAYINGLATWLSGVQDGTNITYSVRFDWSGNSTFLSNSGQITNQPASATNPQGKNGSN